MPSIRREGWHEYVELALGFNAHETSADVTVLCAGSDTRHDGHCASSRRRWRRADAGLRESARAGQCACNFVRREQEDGRWLVKRETGDLGQMLVIL